MPEAGEALRLLWGADLFAPRLLGYELAQVAVKKIALHPAKREGILEALTLACRLRVHWVDIDPIAAATLGVELGLTAYDASYLVASRGLGLPLVTFDEELARGAKKSGRRR